MIAILNPECPLKLKADVVRFLENEGLRVIVSETDTESRVGVIGAGAEALAPRLAAMPGVREVRTDTPPYPMVSRETHPDATRIRIGDVVVGGEEVVVIAGPCSVENEVQIRTTAREVRNRGARMLRGGAFKPRTSPYSFQGLEKEGLELLAQAREETGLPVVTEIVAPEDVEFVGRYADVYQVGARNMQNFRLLSALGDQHKPVLLKRGMSATVNELLHAAEYIMSAGNPRVILCERGIRTYETATRNTLDVGAVAVLKAQTHLPVFVDPSHASGLREYVAALARAGIAAGADGLIVEVHPKPEEALSDGRQSLTPDGFGDMMAGVGRVAEAMGRTLASMG